MSVINQKQSPRFFLCIASAPGRNDKLLPISLAREFFFFILEATASGIRNNNLRDRQQHHRFHFSKYANFGHRFDSQRTYYCYIQIYIRPQDSFSLSFFSLPSFVSFQNRKGRRTATRQTTCGLCGPLRSPMREVGRRKLFFFFFCVQHTSGYKPQTWSKYPVG